MKVASCGINRTSPRKSSDHQLSGEIREHLLCEKEIAVGGALSLIFPLQHVNQGFNVRRSRLGLLVVEVGPDLRVGALGLEAEEARFLDHTDLPLYPVFVPDRPFMVSSHGFRC